MKQEGRVLGPYLRTKKAFTSATTLKGHQNATNLLVPAPHKSIDAGGFTSFKNILMRLPRLKK
jgi:hypothetical protein